jgi:glucokinase
VTAPAGSAPAPRSRRVLGLDLGGTNIKTAVLDLPGDDLTDVTIGAVETVPTHAERGPAGVVARLIEVAGPILDAAAAVPVAAIGIGLPGLFDPGTGNAVLLPNLPGVWAGQPVRDPIAAALDRPVTLINDARAFTLAEGTLGAARGCTTVVCMTLGTGVGGGVMIEGRVRLGAFGTAGEIGHQTVVPDGPVCGCGNPGCVEALTMASVLADLGGRATAAEVYAAAAAGDERCREAIATVAEYLGVAIANTYHLLGPDRVVIGGGIASAGDAVLEPIRAAVRRRATLVPTDRIDIVAASLGSAAGAIGAGLAAAQELVRAR